MLRTVLLASGLASVLASILAVGCKHGGADTPPVAPPPDVGREAAHSGAHAASAQAPAAKPAPARLFYDLAAHPERAELRRGDVLQVDFGEAGDAKYTLGGWKTGSALAYAHDAGHARLFSGKTARVALPVQRAGPATLTLSVRGFAAGPLVIYFDGETVGEVALDGRALQTHSLALNDLSVGEHELLLRVRRLGPSPRGRSAGVALDWLTLAPGSSQRIPADGSANAAEPLVPLAAERGIELPKGMRAGYALQVPAQAELRGELTSGAVELTAHRDGAPPLSLGRLSERGAFAFDLGALTDRVARIDIAAVDDAKLSFAQVVVRDDSAAQPAAPPIKNAIVLLVDTLRADKLAPYRPDTPVQTPGLATFVRDASVMLNARSQENWTKPSVATLLSSLFPWQHNAVTGDAKLPNSVEILPELLRKRGYYTGSFIANGYVSDKFGFKQGWNTYRNYIREGRRTKAQYVAADVLDWLDERPKDKRFFLYVHTIDPHVPYRPPDSFLERYDAEPYSGPVDFRRTNALLEKVKVGSLKLGERDRRHLEALYNAEISYHDVHFAAIMEGLARRGLDRDTVVVVTADHGEEFWDHGSVGHGHSVYDELLHVPLIVRLPGVTDAGGTVSDAVGLVDVMPTVLDALGEDIPAHLMGHSFLDRLRGEGSAAPRVAASGFMDGWRTLGVGRLKLVQRGLDRMYLYDLVDDPGEEHDIAGERPLALRYVRGLLGLSLARAQAEAAVPEVARARAKRRRERTEIDPETRKQLRALGYVH